MKYNRKLRTLIQSARLVKTVTTKMFARITFLSLACTSMANADHVLTRFEEPEKVAKTWTPLTDKVTGGRSEIAARLNEAGHLEIKGNLSFDNDGGFARIYGPELACPRADYDAVKLRFKGDGRCYNFTVVLGGDQGCWVDLWKETVKGEWMDLIIPLDQFKPTPDSDLDTPFTTSSGKKLSTVVMVSGRAEEDSDDNYEELKATQAGDFQLEIASIILTKAPKAGAAKKVKADAGKAQEGHVLTQFESNEQVQKAWRRLNDDVMGGLSTGAVRLNGKGNLEFFGSLSYENRGGFSKVRREKLVCPDADYDTIEMKVKGDGKMYHYSLSLEDQKNPKIKHSGDLWKNSVKGEWTTLTFRLSQFKPAYGVKGNPPLTTTRGKVLSLYLTAAPYPSISQDPKVVKKHREEQVGKFVLEVESIKLTNSKKAKRATVKPAK